MEEIYDTDIDMAEDYRFNPVLSAKNEYRKNTTNTLQANLSAEYEIIKNLKFKVSATTLRKNTLYITKARREIYSGPLTPANIFRAPIKTAGAGKSSAT